ncbi:Alpha/Beta hydrolase protein [Naematelia encephala]|uniref:Alpha/Beta hydrolase protein n=1 Tax=Naematelia encephala TaxID=71784 RepID=A0A1Y2APJ8_9TREE|nr:Alpha/Beta hydrolase protein [Naematelia encephala]
MPTSFEGLDYERHLFKSVVNNESDGCFADVYFPKVSNPSQEPHPIALYYHGGGFTLGDSMHIFIGQFRYLLDRGFCVVSVEYRLAPHYRFRHQREDWVDGYRWTIEKLPKLVQARVDTSRIFVFGGSAGGTASLFLGLDAVKAALPPPRAILAVYPALDFDKPGLLPTKHYDYDKIDELINSLSLERQDALRELIRGPSSTSFDFKASLSGNANSPRWLWYQLAQEYSFLVSCYLEEPGAPFSRSNFFIDLVGPQYPPTVLIKALDDTLLDATQTSDAYERLKQLNVDVKLIEAHDMKHGDAEGENDMKEHPAREAGFWDGVFDVALDWCIERTASRCT